MYVLWVLGVLLASLVGAATIHDQAPGLGGARSRAREVCPAATAWEWCRHRSAARTTRWHVQSMPKQAENSDHPSYLVALIPCDHRSGARLEDAAKVAANLPQGRGQAPPPVQRCGQQQTAPALVVGPPAQRASNPAARRRPAAAAAQVDGRSRPRGPHPGPLRPELIRWRREEIGSVVTFGVTPKSDCARARVRRGVGHR